jgi:hypothetical protein
MLLYCSVNTVLDDYNCPFLVEHQQLRSGGGGTYPEREL